MLYFWEYYCVPPVPTQILWRTLALPYLALDEYDDLMPQVSTRSI